ncbi:MAG: ribonuclease Y [Candidatus Krumholzibacteriia bacterium]
MPQVPGLVAVIAMAAGLVLGILLQRRLERRARTGARMRADEILAQGRREAAELRKNAELEAREELLQRRQRLEEEGDGLRREHSRRLDTLEQRETGLHRKASLLDEKEARLGRLDEQLKARAAELDAQQQRLRGASEEQRRRLEEIAGLTADDARRQLMDAMVDQARHSAAVRIKEIQDETDRSARRTAQKILSQAVQRYAADHVAEETVAVVVLPGDEMKGRIIGREGRNIRAFEIATGMDVIIDDTPEAVIISGFDPIRREVATMALRRLIKDGRIHPGRIEEVVEKTRQEVDERIRELGEAACVELGLQHLNPGLHDHIGRLHYRSSYGQNVLMHSKEVAALGGIIADELGLDGKLARRCGFLHDVGKAADHEQEGPHALVGARICRKLGESDIVINAVGGHHGDVEPISPYTFITAAADAASASRPGARRESLENYVKRLESLERIAQSFDGVDKSYAIQAGREIRILVNAEKVSDAEAALLADEISRRVEGELEYPGQIKVMVIRETRATAIAR